jgi:excinuclease UvrABC nuclease subunit
VLEGFVDVTSILRAGVYALMREGVVVYVGQSKKMLSRIEAHRSQWGRAAKAPSWLPIKGILFDEIHVLPCRVEDLNRLEAAIIDLYKPKFNIKLKAPTPVATPFTITIAGHSVPFNHPAPSARFERRI